MWTILHIQKEKIGDMEKCWSEVRVKKRRYRCYLHSYITTDRTDAPILILGKRKAKCLQISSSSVMEKVRPLVCKYQLTLLLCPKSRTGSSSGSVLWCGTRQNGGLWYIGISKASKILIHKLKNNKQISRTPAKSIP